jgi:hypothetical protein
MIIALTFLAFLTVALLVYVTISVVEERSAQARVLRDRLASIDMAKDRRPSEELEFLRCKICWSPRNRSPGCNGSCCRRE